MLRIVRLFTIFYVIVLTLLLELPGTQNLHPVVPGFGLRYAHLITFALLGFLVELGRCKKSMLFWIVVLALYACSTEVLQGLLNSICHREFDWQDILQDVLGMLFGTIIGHYCRPLVQRLFESLDKKG